MVALALEKSNVYDCGFENVSIKDDLLILQ